MLVFISGTNQCLSNLDCLLTKEIMTCQEWACVLELVTSQLQVKCSNHLTVGPHISMSGPSKGSLKETQKSINCKSSYLMSYLLSYIKLNLSMERRGLLVRKSQVGPPSGPYLAHRCFLEQRTLHTFLKYGLLPGMDLSLLRKA